MDSSNDYEMQMFYKVDRQNLIQVQKECRQVYLQKQMDELGDGTAFCAIVSFDSWRHSSENTGHLLI